MDRKFTALMILDGFGFRKDSEGNAVRLAGTPNIDAVSYTHLIEGILGGTSR